MSEGDVERASSEREDEERSPERKKTKRRFTEDEIKAMARHMASKWEDWDDMTIHERWQDFVSKPEVRRSP